ncbi:PadR family transcriptional regulator [Phenylobacterium montanum]|uniref:PadR family transcriptional regulator n=2 Tax=Phenylobacterium montanum TaxID=2823693 RepID=A0A975G446_9CAUL|nr:PadR family transcriptional regulator [Caulobacter sp. S6]
MHREQRARHGFGWGERGPHGFGRSGRRERVFEQGDLRLLLLQLIAEKPRHGYELIKAVEDSVGGAYSPSPGVVYPTLTLLEDLGYARPTEEGGKKLYTITPEGQAQLDSQAEALAELKGRVDQAAAASRGRDAPQLVRAMENLKTALRLRLTRGPLSDAQVEALAAALDAAAKAVEQA